jgi:collagenase-like PrtC family protease
LHKHGVDVVTLSLEMSQNEIKNVVDSYRQKFNQNPNIEITVYGHQNLMTLKYCPLRRYGECGKCQDHTYELEDSYSKFPTSRKDCITHIYNDKALNLIDDLNEIRQLTNRIRLQFTIEDQAETRKVIEEYMEKINNPYNSKSYFNKKMDTRGYYKREVL